MNTSTQDLTRLSLTQRTRDLRGRVGQRVLLTYGPQDASFDVVVVATAVDALQGEYSRETLLVAQAYDDGRQVVFPIKALRTLTPREFALTDPNHPDFDRDQMPVEVIQPRTVQRRGETRPVRVVAVDRDESESCEAGTPGCCIDHTRSGHGVNCETW